MSFKHSCVGRVLPSGGSIWLELLLNACHFICVCLMGGGIISVKPPKWGGGGDYIFSKQTQGWYSPTSIGGACPKVRGAGGDRLSISFLYLNIFTQIFSEKSTYIRSLDFENTEIYCINCNFINIHQISLDFDIAISKVTCKILKFIT